MRSFRNILITVVSLAAMGYTGYYLYTYAQNPCDKVLGYSIGRFDEQFGITQDQFKASLASAASVWESQVGRPLFAYDPAASFKVNLIYDERQLETVQKQKTESGLEAIESSFRDLDARFASFKSQYEQRLAAYNAAVAAYQSRKSAYDQEVSKWNGKGGAPSDRYSPLEAERQYLNSEASRLNSEMSALNSDASKLNALLAERNTKASQYNSAAKIYNSRYDQGLEFNQAEYNGREINVYQFGNQKDLALALTHEFGHALGLSHVDNPSSVMYYITGINASSDPALTSEDIAALSSVCSR